MRAQLTSLIGIKPALKQGAENARVDLGPVARRRASHQRDVVALQRQCLVIVEQAAIEPIHSLEPDAAALAHCCKQ